MLIMKQQGLGLTELLIGVFIGLLVLGGVVAFLTNLSNYSARTLESVRLEHELQTALDLMANDIRRAGYWANASNMVATGTNSNPFMASTTDLSVPFSSCILFSYDLNKDGNLPSLGAANSDERFGYRLSSSAIQTRAVTNTVFNCTSGSWDNLTSSNTIEITSLIFTPLSTTLFLTNPVTTESVIIRYVTISVTGQLTNDATVTKTLSTNVRVRNDKYIP